MDHHANSGHKTKRGVRDTISEPVGLAKILARLLKWNHERYAEEVATGLHDKKKRGASRGQRQSRTTTTLINPFAGWRRKG